MPFCPVCKNEYREGILYCPDCNCALTNELSNDTDPVLSIRSASVLKRFLDYLSYSKIPVRTKYNEESGQNDLFCAPEDVDRVKRAFSVFVSVETGNALASVGKNAEAEEHAFFLPEENDEFSVPDDWEDALTARELTANLSNDINELLNEDAVSELTTPEFLHKSGTPTEYVSAADRQRETKESGITLIAVGVVLGIIDCGCLVSSALNPFALMVMGALALVMVLYGVYSLRKSSKLRAVADAEEQLKDEIQTYLSENVTKDRIVAEFADSDADGPERDLLQQKYCLSCLKEHFPDASESLLLYLADDWYSKLFDDEESEEES